MAPDTAATTPSQERRAEALTTSAPVGTSQHDPGRGTAAVEMCRRSYSVGVDPLKCVHGQGVSHAITDEDRRCEADDRTSPLRVFVTETVEFEITVDPTEPRWEWLQGSPRAEWVGELDSIATETDGPVEHAIKTGNGAVGAWREVTEP